MAKRVIIAGPPCAGKSTYAREHMERGEVLYDYDTVHQALSGLDSYLHDQRIRPYVLAARDAIIGLLEREKGQGCWVITSSPKKAEIESLKQRLGAEVVLLMVDQEEAHRRCDADHRPAEWHGYIDDWYRRADVAAEKCLSKGWQKEREMHKTKTFSLASFKTLEGEGEAEGVFEAIVAVFNNVDRAGDKIIPGAFKNTLQRWEADGAPIPVIFSHEWDNLDAHVGEVLKAEEIEQGLYVKGQLDMEEDFARRVWKKMKRRTLRQFSFAYDEVKVEQVDGVNELRELELFEVGPCLVGMNPETQLLGVKAGARHSAKDNEMLQEIHDLAVALGAKCAEPPEDTADAEDDGEGAGQDEAGDSGAQSSGKSRSQMLSAIGRMKAWLETVE